MWIDNNEACLKGWGDACLDIDRDMGGGGGV
jgi:hypothetical protein